MVCWLSEGSAVVLGWHSSGSTRYQAIQPGPCLCSRLKHPQEGEGGMEPLGWGAGELVSVGSDIHSPCCPISATSIPLPHQEYLSSTLAALRSNQIITLKVCRLRRVSWPCSAERHPGHRAQHCMFSGLQWEGVGLSVQWLPMKVAMTWKGYDWDPESPAGHILSPGGP